MNQRRLDHGFGLLLFAMLVGCASGFEPEAYDDDALAHEVAEPVSIGSDFDLRADTIDGPTHAQVGSPTEVWMIRNWWSDTSSTAEARAAGLAWGASSGLNWEQKYQRWIASLQPVQGLSGDQTFAITTPWGDTIQAPSLECADVLTWARATFASWYGLPFFLRGKMKPEGSSAAITVYAGHFGFVKADGSPFPGMPRFREAYGARPDWHQGAAWTSDATLRAMHIGPDDDNAFLDADSRGNRGAGAYYDRIYINKRVGYFMRLLDRHFRTGNLADDANMYQVELDRLAPGDGIVLRHDATSGGHALMVMRAAHRNGRLTAEVASGSMPRRQPLWEDEENSYFWFAMNDAGGPGFSQYGGGFKRFRTPLCQLISETHMRCSASPFDAESQISQDDTAAIEARVANIESLWRQYTPQERLSRAVERIEFMRERIRQAPSSCSSRERREAAFDTLVELAEQNGYTRAQVDASFRTLEDYVFGQLSYLESKTCCWNSTTRAMFDIVMEYNRREQARAAARGACVEPTVFRAVDDDYAVFRDFAESIGRGHEWRPWRADEACPQAFDSELTDPLSVTYEVNVTPFCER